VRTPRLTAFAAVAAMTAAGAWAAEPPGAGVLKPTPAQPPAKPAFEPSSSYTTQEIEGWTIRVHQRLLAEQKEPGGRALPLLRVKLYDVARVVPPRALQELRKVPFWVEYNNPQVVCACYHPSRQWLQEHSFNPEKAGAVEIGNVENFLQWSHHQPSMVLHELAHAYHHQVLGWDHPEIEALYRQAVQGKSYESVLAHDGRKRRHYAMNDAKEYFAESSEALFGTNDFYPFVRAELRQHDPSMAALLEKLWENPPRAAPARKP